MTKSTLNRLNKRFSSKSSYEKKIIIDFFDTYYNAEELGGHIIMRQCEAINQLTKNRTIRELSSDKIFTEELFSNQKYTQMRQYAYTFIIYLCEYNLVPNSCLYRILNIKDLIYPATPQTVMVVKNYLSLRDEQYDSYNSLYKNDSKAKRICNLFYCLDESIFSDKKLYNELNNYLQMLKFQLKNNSCCYYSQTLRTFFKIINELTLKYSNGIKLDSILELFDKYKMKSTKVFLDIIKKFYDCDYFTNTSVKKFIYLIKKIDSCNRIPKSSLYAIKKNIVSGKIDYFLLKNGVYPIFCLCSDPKKRKALNYFADYYKNSILNINLCFLEEFDKSLLNPSAPLSFYTYLEQINYFKNRGELIEKAKLKKYYNSIFGIIHAFYSFYQNNYDKELFDRNGYTTVLLNRGGTAHYIAKGYTVINYNQLESIPNEDKWVLCYKNSKSSAVNTVRMVDFTFTENEIFKQWSKYFVWYSNKSTKRKIEQLSDIKKAFVFIDSIKQRKINSYYVTDITASDNISLQEVRAYKNYILSHYDNINTQTDYLSHFREILNFLSLNNIAKFEDGIFIELKYLPVSSNSGNANPIPNKDLESISREISRLARKNTINKIYQIVFYLLIETEFRFSQIANLSIDCIRETAKDNEYVLFSETKTSSHERIEQPITLFTKKCIDEALRLTSEYRQINNNTSIKDLLFVVPHNNKKGAFHILHDESFNKFLKDICKKLNLEPYTICNLRDTHMTKSEEYIIKQHLSDIQLGILTSHSSSVITRTHYSQPDIIEMLEASNKVIIGDVNLQGQIIKKVPDNIENKENLVSDECGYCSADTCNVFSELSCMLCKDFVTTLSRKPYFEEQLKLIDSIIQTKELPHDKKDLINRKRLILGYLEAIISMEQELENEYRE